MLDFILLIYFEASINVKNMFLFFFCFFLWRVSFYVLIDISC